MNYNYEREAEINEKDSIVRHVISSFFLKCRNSFGMGLL